MANESLESSGEAALPVKKQKTGGRVKKPLDQMMAEARIRNEIAGMNDDTTLPEELAAIYLCVSMTEMSELRKPSKRPKAVAGGKDTAQTKQPPRLKMIKSIREGAVGQNQKVMFKLVDLRDYQKSITVESSFEAAVKSGMYGFMTIHAPFFAQQEKRSDRGRTVLVGKAWDKTEPEWAARFKELYDGKLRAVWLTPAEAATSRWSSTSAHKAFAKPWLALLKDQAQAVKAALEATEISAVVKESTKDSKARK